MKNLIQVLSFLLFFSISFNANAQVNVGPKVGVHFGNWSIDEEAEAGDTESRLGLQLGVAAEISINEMFSFAPELLYLQKGFKVESSEEFFGYSFDIKSEVILNYLEIPLLFRAKFGNEDGPKFFINAGPSIGYGLTGKAKAETTINGETEKEEDDLDWKEDEVSRLDLGIAAGAGAQIAAGAGDILIEFRYLAGLTNLNDSDDDITAKNTGFGIAVTYLFPMGTN